MAKNTKAATNFKTDPSTERLLPSYVLNIENYRGQYVVVHSAPTAWIGMLIDVERRGEAIGCTIADAGLWVNGELAEVIRPGQKASKDTASSHHFLTYVPIVTAIMPAGYPFSMTSWKPKFRGDKPGDPSKITLANYAEATGQDVETCGKAINNAYYSGKGGFEAVMSLVQAYAEECSFPIPGVASILMSEALALSW